MNSDMISSSKTSEQIDRNDNPDLSNITQATVATIMMPKETCRRLHNRTSAAEEAEEFKFPVKLYHEK